MNIGRREILKLNIIEKEKGLIMSITDEEIMCRADYEVEYIYADEKTRAERNQFRPDSGVSKR